MAAIKDIWIDPPWEKLDAATTTEFSFGYTERNGTVRAYKVSHDPTDETARNAFHRFVWSIRESLKKKNTPWQNYNVSRVKNLLTIEDISRPPEVEQMKLPLTTSLDKISTRLEDLGYLKEAYTLDVIANTLENNWLGNKATLFFDEVSNQGIDPVDASKVIEIARGHQLRAATTSGTLLIDDLREPGADEHVDKIARTPAEAKRALVSTKWNKVFLDHDLGDNTESGYDVIKWLAREVEEAYWPSEVTIVSANPVGRKNIESYLHSMGYEKQGYGPYGGWKK